MKERVKAFVESHVFTTLIFVLILLNTVSLGIETFQLTPNVSRVLSIFNTVCISVFVLEIVLKLYAYGVDFFKDGWNIFDTVIVLVSIMPMIAFLSSMRAFRIFRMFRALRALRMLKRLEKLRVIVQALIRALPSVGWVVVLLAIIYYIFAVIGTNLFAKISPDYFGTLWESLYTLFQITMADDLGNISRPLVQTGIGAVIYFVSFVVLSAILVLNVIVGVVVDSMAEIKKADQEEKSQDLLHVVGLVSREDGCDECTNADLLQEIICLEQQMERVKNLLAAREHKGTDRKTD